MTYRNTEVMGKCDGCRLITAENCYSNILPDTVNAAVCQIAALGRVSAQIPTGTGNVNMNHSVNSQSSGKYREHGLKLI